jgi:predicted small integral membrane protein
MSENFAWMAWTWQTAAFFGAIATILVLMTLWQSVRPTTERIGVLGIVTTRGDRLFITLLGAAFICLGWLAFAGPPLWAALAISLLFALAVFRWV